MLLPQGPCPRSTCLVRSGPLEQGLAAFALVAPGQIRAWGFWKAPWYTVMVWAWNMRTANHANAGLMVQHERRDLLWGKGLSKRNWVPSASPLETHALLLLLLPPAIPHAWAGDQRNQAIAVCPVNPVPNVLERVVISAPASFPVTVATKHWT